MLPNDEPDDDSQINYTTPDYIRPEQWNAPYLPGGLETPATTPEPTTSLQPPARGILAKWLKVLTRPSVTTFASEIPAANWRTTLLGVLIFAIVYVVIIITGVVPPRSTLMGSLSSSSTIQVIVIYGLIINMISLIVANWITYAAAKVVSDGAGDFAIHTYLYTLYAMPIAIIAHLLAVIPGFGQWLDYFAPLLAPAIYSLVLTYFMVRAAYRLKPGSAFLVVLLTLIGAVVAFFILAIFVVSLFPLAGF